MQKYNPNTTENTRWGGWAAASSSPSSGSACRTPASPSTGARRSAPGSWTWQTNTRSLGEENISVGRKNIFVNFPTLLLGRCYWDTSNLGVLWTGEGETVTTAAAALSRPYPLAVAGSQLQYSFDTKARIFRLEFRPDTSIAQPSLVFLPSLVFGDNPHFKHSDDLSVSLSQDNPQILEVRLKQDQDDIKTTRSWVTVGISEDVPSLRSNSWLNYLASFIPFLNR